MGLPISYWTRTTADNTVNPKNGEPETTSLSLPIITLTPGNVAATATLTDNLSLAIQAITLGRVQKKEVIYQRTQFEKIPAASTLAQRENKWLFRYHDAVNFQKYQASQGTADLSLLPTGSEYLDLSAGEGADLKTAFEAVVVSPYDPSHAVILDSAQFVGRNT